jgi:hypothetical protein
MRGVRQLTRRRQSASDSSPERRVLDALYAPRISVLSHPHRDRIEEAIETIGVEAARAFEPSGACRHTGPLGIRCLDVAGA